MASLPILKTIDPHVRVRGLERHLIDHAQLMPHPSGAVMACRIRDASSVLGCLPLGKEMSLIACFDPDNIMPPMIVPGLAVGGIGTPTVFGDEAREMGGILAERGDAAFGGLPFPSIVAWALLGHHGCGHPWKHCASVWRDHGCAHHLLGGGDRPIPVDCVPTRRPGNRWGRNRPRAIECQPRVSITKRHRCKRLATLELPKDARKDRAQPCRQHRIESLPHLGVARDMLHAVETSQIPCDPLCVKGEPRRQLQGNHRERRQERIRQSNVRIAQAVIRNIRQATSNLGKECISGQMLASFRCNNRHGNPRHEDRTWF